MLAGAFSELLRSEWEQSCRPAMTPYLVISIVVKELWISDWNNGAMTVIVLKHYFILQCTWAFDIKSRETSQKTKMSVPSYIRQVFQNSNAHNTHSKKKEDIHLGSCKDNYLCSIFALSLQYLCSICKDLTLHLEKGLLQIAILSPSSDRDAGTSAA